MGIPRQIFLDSCAQVAARLEPHGYRWLKSKTAAVRTEGDWQFRIWFQSSFRNFSKRYFVSSYLWRFTDLLPRLPGFRASRAKASLLFPSLAASLREIHRFGSISLIPWVALENKAFAQWRKSFHLPGEVVISNSNLGYLTPAQRYLEINLARPSTRTLKIDALISAIQESAFPFLKGLSNPQTALERLATEEPPGFLSSGVVEYAMFLGGKSAARRPSNASSAAPTSRISRMITVPRSASFAPTASPK